MQKRIRIGYSTTNPIDQCSLYRSTGPLKAMERQYPEIEVYFIDQNQLNWGSLYNLDVLMLSRPVNENFLKGAKLACVMGKPLWVDFDDDLYCVPWNNGEAYYYNKESTRKIISTIVNMASHVTVSTPELKSINEPISRQISVIPNAWDFEIFSYKSEQKPINKNLITWRGSPTHDPDILCVKDGIISFAKKNPNAKFKFFGAMPWMLQEIASQIEYETVDRVQFNAVFWDHHPKLHIAPLENNRFNRAKSNISWIEGTHAGAVTIACDLPEWDRPGIAKCEPKHFGEMLDLMFNNDDLCDDSYSLSTEYIKQNLDLKKVNHQRYDVLMGLIYG